MKHHRAIGFGALAVIATVGLVINQGAGAEAGPTSGRDVQLQDTQTDGSTVVETNVLEAVSRKNRETTESSLACTNVDEAPNFPTYFVGKKYRGLFLTAVIRRCDTPRANETARANYVSYIYGDCDPSRQPTDGGVIDTGCAPPLEIQSYPACERSYGDYSFVDLSSAEELETVQGVPAAYFASGARGELYTRGATVVVFGNADEDVQNVLREVRARPISLAPGENLDSDAGAEEPMPATPEALSGKLSCLDK